MFKTYLRTRTKGFQLSVFLFIWAGLFLIAIFLQNTLIRHLYHIDGSQLEDFISNSMGQHPDFVIISNAIYSIMVFALPAFLFAYLAHPSPTAYLGIKQLSAKNKKQGLWALLIAVGMVPVLSMLGGAIKELNLGEAAKHLQELRDSQINTYLQQADVWDLMRNLVLLALLPAFCEELFFRGLLQKFAYSYWKSARGAIFVSAFAFAFMHMSVYDFLPIFLAGLLLAWIYQQTSCLWLNVTVHFLFNALQVAIAFLAVHYPAFNQAGQNMLNMSVVSLLGLGILLFAVKKIYKLHSPLPKNWGVEEVVPKMDSN